jgi:Glycosyl transferases group 1
VRIVIAGNIGNQIGLQRDYELLRAYLETLGHEVFGQQDNRPADTEIPVCDLGIFLETISEHLVPMAKRFYYIANCEWLKPEFIRPIQRHCEKVFAKTREAERILREKFSRVHYIGFLTADKGDISIKREAEFLHVGGNGGHRGTNAVIAAWREYRYWNGLDAINGAHLTVISNSKTVEVIDDVPGITFIKRASEEELRTLQNRCLFHIQPSGTEGFGHALHESQSVGAILLTTQAPPMTELHAPFEIPSIRTKKANLGTVHEVSPAAIREMVPKMLALPNYEVAKMKIAARARFEKDNREFAELFGPHLEPTREVRTVHNPPTRGSRSPLRISMLGNFGPPHSTENDLLWTLRDMGHTVIPFQENQDTAEEIVSGSSGANLFLWIHTHGWDRIDFEKMIFGLWGKGVLTASFHLDRYWGLNKLDRREDRIGSHWFWKTEHVFTADGGNQSLFEARGVRHRWLPPGVVKRDCYPGTPREELKVDVGFVGAEGYHPEYPFRGELIGFLRSVYGEKFRVFNGYRGAALNAVYASVRVVVGDSCFGGSDRYWSDRIPETIGRGGFLLHPATRGLTIPGLVTFEPENLAELQDRIDYFLEWPEERDYLRRAAHVWVRENETYHQRMARLLGVCGL